MTNTTPDEYRVKVEQELSDLLDMITNLTKFLYGNGLLNANLSMRMKALLHIQLGEMTAYAKTLQSRLAIWGKTDEELEKEREAKA